MPIKIPDNLPAANILAQENIFVMKENRAKKQDIRALEIVILNIMPKKIETETQLLRLLSNTSLQVNVELLQTATYKSKNTPNDHLITFYKTFEQIKHRHFDGMIITGAPVENMEFEEVEYWQELCEIMEWSKTNVYSTYHICWGAQAGLYYHHGIQKYPLKSKMFGIFEHDIKISNHRLLRGFDERYFAPHSRHTEIRSEDIDKNPDLQLLSSSQAAGVYIASDKENRRFYVTGHSEYDRDTLAVEYFRDKSKGLEIEIPFNYFPNNDDSLTPVFVWRAHAHLLFSNWLNYFVYQETPFNFVSS